jgi:hypothetical protein
VLSLTLEGPDGSCLQALANIHSNPATALAAVPVAAMPVLYRSVRGGVEVTPAEQEEVRALRCQLHMQRIRQRQADLLWLLCRAYQSITYTASTEQRTVSHACARGTGAGGDCSSTSCWVPCLKYTCAWLQVLRKRRGKTLNRRIILKSYLARAADPSLPPGTPDVRQAEGALLCWCLDLFC